MQTTHRHGKPLRWAEEAFDHVRKSAPGVQANRHDVSERGATEPVGTQPIRSCVFGGEVIVSDDTGLVILSAPRPLRVGTK